MSPLLPFAAHWPALSILLDEALGLPAPERTAWLDALAGERATHREALGVLLANQAAVETDDFLAALPALSALHGLNGADASAPFDGLAAGSSVGGYRLIAEIGQGGMGMVWLAERADGLISRRVALKLPRIVWGDTFAERMAREREILATLEHEHIARLYDTGVDAQGRPFLAMEYVEGVPIDVYCRTNGSSFRERLALLLQAAAAVSHAHSKLVVHRDLKPGNVLVTRAGSVKLLDFGIAKLIDGDKTRRTALTELAGRALTLDYASPEQIRGEPLGTASDVYSLGVLAYELLVHARPYKLKRGSAAEIEEAIMNAEPLRASDAAVTPAVRKALRGDLDAILNLALKKNPAERYATVDALAQDIERHLRGEPVQARPDSRRYRAAKFVRRHLLAVAMTSALTTAVVGGAGFSLWQMHVAREQERLAYEEFEGAGAVRELYVETMAQLSVTAANDPQSILQPHAVTLALRQKLDDMSARSSDRPRDYSAMLFAVTLQLDRSEELEAGLSVGTKYLESLKAQNAPPYQVIQAHALLGSFLFRLRRYDECEAIRRAGAGWAPDSHDKTTVIYRSDIASALGSVLRIRGKRAEAEAVFARNEQTNARLLPDHQFRFKNLVQFTMFWLGWDEARALQYAEAANKVSPSSLTFGAREKAEVQRALASAFVSNGQARLAESPAVSALNGFVSVYGYGSRNTMRAVTAVADAISRQGDYARSALFIADQQRLFAAQAGGLSTAMERLLRAQRLENAWLSGDSEAATSIFASDEASLLAPAALADSDWAALWSLLALDLAGRPRDALAALAAYRKTVSPQSAPTLTWIRILEVQAQLELAAGQSAQARETAGDLLAMLTSERATAGRAHRVAAELVALAAARSRDKAAAARALARADAGPQPPPFPSPVEQAESRLRRSEVLLFLGRNTESVDEARAALVDLAGQHPDSPRLRQARRLIGSAGNNG